MHEKIVHTGLALQAGRPDIAEILKDNLEPEREDK